MDTGTQIAATEAQDWDAVAIEVIASVLARMAPVAEQAADALYERLLTSVQDYLTENIRFNISSRLDAAERERWAQYERAEKAEQKMRSILAVLRNSAEGWSNAIELGIISPQHLTVATVLRDQARAAVDMACAQ